MDASVSKHSLATRKSLKCDDGWLQAEVVARHSNRRRRDVLEMDSSICITRRSHRRRMIFMLSASGREPLRDPVRFYGGARQPEESGRAVDWD